MKSRTDIYQYDRQLKLAESYLEGYDISEKNKETIRKFRDYGLMQGFSKPRILKYHRVLRHLAKMLEKDLETVEKEDIERLVAKINSYPSWAAATKYDMKIMVKRFYKWLLGNEEDYPECIKWLKPRLKRTEKKLPNDGELLTEEDIEKAIEFTENLRDKALITSLYESGCRVGELSSLRIRDVSFDKLGTVLSVTGKTDPRKIRIVSSTPYLANWINNHPLRKKRESPIRISLGAVNKHQKLDYDTIRMLIKKAFTKAGIDKKHNPHIFRHSRATFLAIHLTEFQMNQYFG